MAIAAGMASACVFSPVLGVGGVRSALLATRLTASPLFAAVPQGSLRMGVAAAASARARVASPVPPMAGIAAHLRASPSTSRFLAGAGVLSPFGSMAGVAARLPPTPSTSVFPASASAGLRPWARTLRCGAKSAQEGTPPPPQPLRRSFFSKFLEGWKELKAEAEKSAFKLMILFLGLVLANLSFRQHPYTSRAFFVIAMCNRSEKFVKFVSHLIPILAAFWKGFYGPDSN